MPLHLCHLALRYSLFLLLLLAQAAAWRFGPAWLGLSASGALLIFTLIFSATCSSCWRQQQLFAYTCACILCVIGLFSVLWPCELSCSKGADFASIFDIPVLRIASICYALTVLFLLFKSPRLGLLQQSLSWTVCGGSLFFLGLSIYLQMLCPLCLAIHSCILAATICAWPMRRSLLLTLTWVILGSASIGGLYALAYYQSPYWSALLTGSLPTVLTPQADPTINPLDAFAHPNQNPQNQAIIDQSNQADPAIIEHINQARSLGDPQAPYQLAFFIRLNCEHCAQWVPHVYSDSKAFCTANPISIRFHYLVNRLSSSSIKRHQLALIAGLDDKFFLAQSALLGSEADVRGFDESLANFDLSLTRLESAAKQQQASLLRIIHNDQQLLDSGHFSSNNTPILYLLHHGQVIARWDGSTDWAAIKIAIHERILADGQK